MIVLICSIGFVLVLIATFLQILLERKIQQIVLNVLGLFSNIGVNDVKILIANCKNFYKIQDSD
jgi:hypothetical protein